MSGIPALGSPALSGLLAILRSWLKLRPSDMRPGTEMLSREAVESNAPFNGAPLVLVADDNPANLMLMSAQMESRGFMPMLAADGAEAVALACELQFDLILMDLQMPVLDGLGATSAIRSAEAQGLRRAVPVLAYSSSPISARVLARHGLNGKLAKPCGDQELEDCLLRWCPAYRPSSAGSGAAQGQRFWPPARRASGTGSAAVR